MALNPILIPNPLKNKKIESNLHSLLIHFSSFFFCNIKILFFSSSFLFFPPLLLLLVYFFFIWNSQSLNKRWPLTIDFSGPTFSFRIKSPGPLFNKKKRKKERKKRKKREKARGKKINKRNPQERKREKKKTQSYSEEKKLNNWISNYFGEERNGAIFCIIHSFNCNN